MSELHKTQAILLLTAHFSDGSNETVKPLTLGEWERFAGWLRKRELYPWDLETGNIHAHLKEWSDKSITLERLDGLLHRGTALALAMEKWTRAGLWILTRSDYPKRFKKRLGTTSPIVVFGCGNKALLRDGGLAVIGSRNAVEEDLTYSRGIGSLAAESGISVVSGGARGVDESAMLGALANNGNVVGVLAENLLRASSSKKYRKYLVEERLALISSFYPEARFNVGNAMERNKYIYCLSDAALVVHSDRKKGGTWEGAMRNLKKNWVPLWVKRTADKNAGNAEIVSDGGKWAPENIDDVRLKALISTDSFVTRPIESMDQLSISEGEAHLSGYQAEQSADLENEPPQEKTQAGYDVDGVGTGQDPGAPSQIGEIASYEHFVAKLKVLCKDHPKTPEQLLDLLDLQKTELNVWLKQAVQDDKLKKLQRPVRYQWKTKDQGELFFNKS